MSGIIESIGHELGNGVISSEYLDARRIFGWELAAALPVANLVSRRAVGFDVTNELSTMTPYGIPQAWARALHEAGHGGIRYRTRFDTGATARGIAHFGPAGPAHRPAGRPVAIDQRLRQRLHDECGLRIVPPPRLDELEVAPDP